MKRSLYLCFVFPLEVVNVYLDSPCLLCQATGRFAIQVLVSKFLQHGLEEVRLDHVEGGSIVVEKVFNWPGLGRLLVDSVEMRDYPVIQAEVLLFSLEFILINLVVDVLYAAINPAIRYK